MEERVEEEGEGERGEGKVEAVGGEGEEAESVARVDGGAKVEEVVVEIAGGEA